MSVSAEEKKRYFQEAAIALRREGFKVEPSVGGRLAVWLDDHPLCEVDQIGGITYRSDNIPTPEYVAAKDKAYRIVCSTAEYMKQMEQAPPLKVSDLPDRYKVLADFNGVVLAGAHRKYGVEFVTWDWDHDRKGLSHGHYFNGNYEGAKRDFATRSGLSSLELVMQIKGILTETQFRRLWMYYVKGMTEAEIAKKESVGQRRVSTSITDAEKKIKKFCGTRKNGG